MCGESGSKGFFEMPKTSPEQELWRENLGLSEDHVLGKFDVICWRHFKREEFAVGTLRLRLLKGEADKPLAKTVVLLSS